MASEISCVFNVQRYAIGVDRSTLFKTTTIHVPLVPTSNLATGHAQESNALPSTPSTPSFSNLDISMDISEDPLYETFFRDLSAMPPLCNIWACTKFDDPLSCTDPYSGPNEPDGAEITQHILPTSFLLCVDKRCPGGLTLKEIFRQTLPLDLWESLQAVSLYYDSLQASLSVTIGSPVGDTQNDNWRNYEHTPWKRDFDISEVSITVVDSVEDVYHYRIALWMLNWFHRFYSHTVDTLSISLPDDFSKVAVEAREFLHQTPSDSGSSFIPSKFFHRLRILCWKGSPYFMAKFVPILASQTVEMLTITSGIGTADALSFLRHFAESKLHTLSLSTLVDNPPALQGKWRPTNEKIGSANLPQTLQSFPLPNLDTLTLASSIPLTSFLACVSLPNLCSLTLKRVENDNSKYHYEEILHSFLASPTLNGELLYVGVHCNASWDRVAHLKGLIQQQIPQSYVFIS